MPIGYRESCRQPLFDGFSPRPRASCAPRAPIFPTVRPTRPTSRESTMMGLARPAVGWIGAWRSARMQPGGCSREDAAGRMQPEVRMVSHGGWCTGRWRREGWAHAVLAATLSPGFAPCPPAASPCHPPLLFAGEWSRLESCSTRQASMSRMRGLPTDLCLGVWGDVRISSAAVCGQ